MVHFGMTNSTPSKEQWLHNEKNFLLQKCKLCLSLRQSKFPQAIIRLYIVSRQNTTQGLPEEDLMS